jgi:L-ascorbate 6-phosphate lactonase
MLKTIVREHGDLVREINERTVPPGKMCLWWLGQHSFVVKAGTHILYIDGFWTNSSRRMVPPILTPEESASHASIFFGSHDHGDHIDRDAWPTLAAHNTSAKFVVPDLVKDSLAKDLNIPASRFIGLDDGQTIEPLSGVKVTALASAHEFLERCPTTGRYRFLGFVIEAGGATLYHPGDTCIYEGLYTKLSKWAKFDAMLLPINGRDAGRYQANIIGNMTYQEAVDLAGTLKPGVVMPTHWDMFAGNPGDVLGFCRYMQVKYPGQRVIVPNYGEAFEIGR